MVFGRPLVRQNRCEEADGAQSEHAQGEELLHPIVRGQCSVIDVSVVEV